MCACMDLSSDTINKYTVLYCYHPHRKPGNTAVSMQEYASITLTAFSHMDAIVTTQKLCFVKHPGLQCVVYHAYVTE
jgi:hypothetical protein